MQRYRASWPGRLLVLLALALAAGCAALGRPVEPPLVSVSDFEWAESGTFEQRFRITLRIQNPNPFDLAVDGLDFQFDLNGQRLTRALSSEPFTLPRLGEQQVSVIATTTLLDAVRQLIRGDLIRDMRWELRGRVFLDPGGSVEFANAGQLVP